MPNLVAIDAGAGRYVVDSLQSVTPSDSAPRRRRRRRRRRAATPGARPRRRRRRRWALVVGAARAASRSSSAGVVAVAARRRRRRRRPPRDPGRSTSRLDAVLGARRRPADARRRAPTRSTSCRRSGSRPPASTRSSSRPTRRRGGRAFIDTARGRRRPARRLDPRRHRAGRDGGDPRRPGRSGPRTSTRSPSSPPTAASPASTSTTSSSPSPTAATLGGDPPELGGVRRASSSARLHADGRTLTVSIPPVYDGGQTDDSGYWVYDYAAITPLVDAIRDHGLRLLTSVVGPGPDRPARLGRGRHRRRRPAASGDPSKLVLGIPLYGYNWVDRHVGHVPGATAEGDMSLANAQVDDLVARRGATPQFDPATASGRSRTSSTSTDGAQCTQQREVHYVDADGVQSRMQTPSTPGSAACRCSPSATRTPRCGTPRRGRRRTVREPADARRRRRTRRLSGQHAAMRVHLVDGTYELFRQNFGRAGQRARRRAVRGDRRRAAARRCSCSPTAPPTSAWPATTSSRASATTCGRATRRARACRPNCWRRSRSSRRRSRRWA